MRVETVPLAGATPGAAYALTLLHFGDEGAEPKAYVQAGLHADEAPGMLCAHHLRGLLGVVESQAKVRGHIVLVPAANPLGMGQFVLGSHHGRFSLEDGGNYNRGFPDLTDRAAALLDDRLGADASANGKLVRAALLAAHAERAAPRRPVEALKARLLAEALAARTVLDLHCDGEALTHLYAHADQAEAFAALAAHLGAVAMLTSRESGGDPFDEAISRPWAALRQRFASHPLPDDGTACTVELRGRGDVDHALAAADAAAIVTFLAERGHLDLPPAPAPQPLCAPTPLDAMEALEAPCAGLIVYRRALGERVLSGEVVAEIVDPVTGESVPVRARASGLFFARPAGRVAHAGKRLCKIAGAVPFRTGALLSP